MTATVADIEAALRDAVPEALRPRVPELAEILAQILAGDVTVAEAQSRLKAAEPVLASLSGESIRGGTAVVDFGEAQIDSLTLGDVAAGNIDKRVSISLQVGQRLLRVGEHTFAHEIERRLVALMRKVEEEGLEGAAAIVGLDLSRSAIDHRWALARKMLNTDLDSLVEAIRLLSAYVCSGAQEMLELAAPFCWVDAEAAARISIVLQRSPGQRGVGLNSTNVHTGRMYVIRGCPRYPPWEVKEVEGGWSELPLADLLIRIESTVRQALGFDEIEEVTPEDLTAELRLRSLFVVLPPPVPDAGLLDAVRQRFPQVTFLLLTGDLRHADFARLKLPFVDYLLPELDTDRERACLTRFGAARRELGKVCLS